MIMSKSLISVLDANLEVVKEYLHTGKSEALAPDHQKTLDICLEVYGMLKRYPQRNICIRTLMNTHGMVYNTAAKYVDFARNTWGSYVDLRREFLETFFLDRLLDAIADKNASESSRSKNLATLQKHLESMPEQKIDPKVMEKNTVMIQVNINGRVIPLPESMLESLPVEFRQQILSAFNGEIDDNASYELLES